MSSLDLNCQRMEPHGALVGTGLMSYSSYVESLVVLVDKEVDVHIVMVTLLWLTGKTVVQLTIEKGDDEVGGEPRKTAAIQENCWKRVNAIPPDYTFDLGEISVPFVNGAVHWIGYQKRNNVGFTNVILGFDLSAEEFFEISLPESLIGLGPMDLSTMKYGESSIAVLKRDPGNEHELWVMKEYGVVGSWTKVLKLNRKWCPNILGFGENGEVLVELDYGKLASLDLNCQQMELHGVEVTTNLISLEGSYVESLVLLDKGIDVHNPSISEAVELNVGFRFDPRNNDYKVIAIPPNYTFDAVTATSLPFVKRAVHWLGYQTRNNDEYSEVIFWVMKEYGVVESWTKPFRKNEEVLLLVDGGELASLNLNCQQMEPRGIEVGTSLLSVEGSYVECLVLLDKGVDVPKMSFANLAIDSSDSDEWSGEESVMG
ncbi:hypothetical protein V6N11_079258 [Hibiscus sabdariffa]|uniref:F-box associated beta-propeller type 1 domain-containing protein n=1 Tax=Hibiscus sabdariffa TaxID=183260 RepID=A0ABR2RVJ2_9ROSI